MKPSDAATYERARRLANLAIWTVSIQRRRLNSEEPEDSEFPFRNWMDFHFFIVALSRLRRAAHLAAKVPAIRNKIAEAISVFDTEIPHLKTMRDVAEHIDDYSLDSGRLSHVSRKELEVASRSGNIWHWLGFDTDIEMAFAAGARLFESIRVASSVLENTIEDGAANMQRHS